MGYKSHSFDFASNYITTGYSSCIIINHDDIECCFDFEKDQKTPPSGRSQKQHNLIKNLNKKRKEIMSRYSKKQETKSKYDLFLSKVGPKILSPQWKLPISIWIGVFIGQVITGNLIYTHIDGVYNFNFAPLVLTYFIMVFTFPYFKKYVLKQEV
jgi:antibiotic biosynthesis monooxygenase (ABM) superfamily enzyme